MYRFVWQANEYGANKNAYLNIIHLVKTVHPLSKDTMRNICYLQQINKTNTSKYSAREPAKQACAHYILSY